MLNCEAQVITNTPLTASVFSLTLRLPFAPDSQVTPGQFYMLKVSGNIGLDPLLRRPISVCAFDPLTQTLRFVIRRVGRGTTILEQLRPGDPLEVFGPLGHGFPYPEEPNTHALLIGGGVGIPPLLYLAQELSNAGVQVTALLGFRSEKEVFLLDEFSRWGTVEIATDDGSLGACGNVCDLLENHLTNSHWSIAYACGPLPMLQRLEVLLGQDQRPVYVSLEKRMACGIGACTACTCKRQHPEPENRSSLVCTDGPVFRLGEVELDV